MSRAQPSQNVTTQCLTPDVLRAYVRGQLDDNQAEAADTHIATCDHCRARTEAEFTSDDLAEGLREAYARDPNLIPQEAEHAHGEAAVLSPDAVPGYVVHDEIHRGGQGVVFEAQQTATKRRVALKVLLHGAFASARQRRRFEREIEMVAGLHHPHIVTIYESGLIADDRPYFAMEYIDGVPLTEYVRQRRSTPTAAAGMLALEQLLQLVLKICAAVSYAHQRGLIHRDLKPSNILIDAGGNPHILDFGLAKAVTTETPEQDASVTAVGEFMGTIAYASPEQVQGDPQLDVRSDVYSLGVLLYEVLTGQAPYDVQGALGDVLNNIASATPEPPRLWWQRWRRGDERTVRQVPYRVPGDLETIVLKCLQKEVDRRYQSVADLARDIRHYLAGEPIEARRDSNWYVLKKTLHRHRLKVVVALAFVAMLLEMVIVSTAYWYQAALDRDRVAHAEVAALEHRARVEAARQATEAARSDLELIVRFQNQLLRRIDAQALGQDLLERIRQRLAGGQATDWDTLDAAEVARVAIHERVLRPAAEALEQDFADRPLIRARLRAMLGAVYCELEKPPEAVRQFKTSLALVRDLLGPTTERNTRMDRVVVTFRRHALYALAEATLLEIHDAAQTAPAVRASLGSTTAQLLANLYRAWEKPEQAERWEALAAAQAAREAETQP